MHPVFADMLTPTGLRHLKELENSLGDMASEDIIVVLVWICMSFLLKGQRLFGQFEDLSLIHQNGQNEDGER